MTCGGGSFAHVSFHAGGDWRVRCNTYPGTTPILTVDGGPSALSISARGRDADEEAVRFARSLAREARKFADEMERMHAAYLAGDGKAAGSDAA